ncbi:MAG: LytTR family transcriptional regulator [Clostridia bacterium]|nr:LytTR family transcriptional regulator [Clostridia bacterium]
MKYTLHIDPEREEEVIVHSHERNELTDAIERLVKAEKAHTPPLVGYIGDDIITIDPDEVFCFFIEDKRLFASMRRGDVRIKKRLCEIEESLTDDFIKINQSALANLRLIDRFSVSFGASLVVHFKNGRREYVSRRQMKAVKERLGL